MPKSITGNKPLAIDTNRSNQPTDKPTESTTAKRRVIKPQVVNNKLSRKTKTDILTNPPPKDNSSIVERDIENDFVMVNTEEDDDIVETSKEITEDDKKDNFNKV